MTALTTPTIHINGTSRDELLECLIDARQAVRTAIDAVCTTAPHGRDYYPQGDAAFIKARDEHLARLKRLHDVVAELGEIAESIA
jgi:hypothetical protein